MIKRLFLFSLFGSWLFIAGCATWEEMIATTPPPPPPPPEVVYPFSDIPIPHGFERNHSKSFVYESGSGTVKVGRFFYSGWSDLNGVVTFYQNEMVNKGWSLVNAIKHETTILNYEKEGWVCSLMIKSMLGKASIEIQAGPK
ncbi:MAG: hypothetical protein H8E42_09735 [Nitrospinae bacterium]|nr:hypothetical protein [Nitrospinota bacterium]MBL7019279.1 hypothetical protein [Nitrospinaceae bacterium]